MVSKWKLKQQCEKKRGYSSHGDANIAAAKAIRRASQIGTPMKYRPYICLVCKRWHLTTTGRGYRPGDEDRIRGE